MKTLLMSIDKGLEYQADQGIFNFMKPTEPKMSLIGRPRTWKMSDFNFTFSSSTVPEKIERLSCSEFRFSIQFPKNLLRMLAIALLI
jgi:hypothetical protein